MSLTFKFRSRALAAALIFAACAGTAWSAAITPEMQQKVDAYIARAAVLAADPALVKSVKEANAKGAIASMDNGKWEPLPETSPVVSEMVSSSAGQLLNKWMGDDAKGLNKLVLTGNQGQRFAFTSKPISYMSKEKAHFTESFSGKVWQQKETQPDPSTKIETVQITVPVRDAGQIIGVLLMSLTAENLRK